MTLRDVVAMEQGDVIPLDIPDHLTLSANGLPMYTCQLGASRGNLAVKIVETIQHDND
ncbi:FliM/FliN family flagellar motor switch protein [Nitrincola sp. A-D6]|uniref:FliM/FliN family flagellar motor switch protein n=1 Tax=Nitrincola sp. A-D6 TaxID=1545442 RepID=UPI003FA57400